MNRLISFVLLALSLTGCSGFFEHSSDVQARRALQDLIAIQQDFHKENKRYAQNLVEVAKYNLTYHAGIVYLEIESADEHGYRAIALPAESTTARAFAYDTKKGGYYEMDEIEVSQYVLGALNYIREQQRDAWLIDLSSYILLGVSFILAGRIWLSQREKKFLPVFGSFYLGMAGLSWAVFVMHHMTPDIVFSANLKAFTAAALGAGIFSLMLAAISLAGKIRATLPAVLIGLVGTSLLVSVFSTAVLLNTLWTYF